MTLYCHPVPAEGFHRNPGTMPDGVSMETKVQVQWACGWIDHNIYTLKQIRRWTLTGHAFDVGAIRGVE